ncbi:leucine-rich repeat-containing protein [Pseudozyma hubeiensis SY62]|uniref:Leucine-rich repeat-containing protein n=1 Tax=Pseudozyma hubeiensis (strain SY62) TaxID=1305764 RepID=R9P6Z1_PSEHS|nr:leucine-rich repeat-containing protein [Pseudozyma hubeiensis SY62]GAC97017.1 leucine-rich repeat-containing protein [Pseudozyma hubeiensis SY62]
MSGISRLLRWAPFLWAVCKLTNNPSRAARPQLLNNQSGTQHPAGHSDLFDSLSFPARTLVRQTHPPRPTLAARPPRAPSPTESERSVIASLPDNDFVQRTVRALLRTRTPVRYAGWQMENPHRLPIRLAQRAVSASSAILNQVRGAHFGMPIPNELQIGILIAARHPVRKSGIFNEVDMLLVCKHWNSIHRPYYWKKRWLNLRPIVASWKSIGERLTCLSKNADVIHNVNLSGVATDILPMSLEQAVRECPEIAMIANCTVEKIKIGRLDSLNEILLKQILLYRQEKIRHFEFQLEDIILFLGRRSIFAKSEFLLPQVRRVTVNISSVKDAHELDDLFGNSARLVSNFVAELVGRDKKQEEVQVELRLVCHSKVQGGSRPQLTQGHIFLVAQIVDFTRELLKYVAGLNLVMSFQAPFRLQAAQNLTVLRIWARENNVSLINA